MWHWLYSKKFIRLGGSVVCIGFLFVLTWCAVRMPVPLESVADSGLVLAEVISADDEVSEYPARLIIKALGVDAQIQHVGLDAGGSGGMAVPSNFTDVGWYQDGIRPGMLGSAVITGHYNGRDTPRAVFYELGTLTVGDEVIIVGEDTVANTFRVVRVAMFDHNAPTAEVFVSHDGKRRLNLITCSGEWLAALKLYSTRTVVFTELVTKD